MYDVRICFEVDGLGVDENDKPCPAGVQLIIGQRETEITKEEYDLLINALDKKKLLKQCFMDDLELMADDVKFLYPADYDKQYGKENENA